MICVEGKMVEIEKSGNKEKKFKFLIKIFISRVFTEFNLLKRHIKFNYIGSGSRKILSPISLLCLITWLSLSLILSLVRFISSLAMNKKNIARYQHLIGKRLKCYGSPNYFFSSIHNFYDVVFPSMTFLLFCFTNKHYSINIYIFCFPSLLLSFPLNTGATVSW